MSAREKASRAILSWKNRGRPSSVGRLTEKNRNTVQTKMGRWALYKNLDNRQFIGALERRLRQGAKRFQPKGQMSAWDFPLLQKKKTTICFLFQAIFEGFRRWCICFGMRAWPVQMRAMAAGQGRCTLAPPQHASLNHCIPHASQMPTDQTLSCHAIPGRFLS